MKRPTWSIYSALGTLVVILMFQNCSRPTNVQTNTSPSVTVDVSSLTTCTLCNSEITDYSQLKISLASDGSLPGQHMENLSIDVSAPGMIPLHLTEVPTSAPFPDEFEMTIPRGPDRLVEVRVQTSENGIIKNFFGNATVTLSGAIQTIVINMVELP
jgi:hypothetical protein